MLAVGFASSSQQDDDFEDIQCFVKSKTEASMQLVVDCISLLILGYLFLRYESHPSSSALRKMVNVQMPQSKEEAAAEPVNMWAAASARSRAATGAPPVRRSTSAASAVPRKLSTPAVEMSPTFAGTAPPLTTLSSDGDVDADELFKDSFHTHNPIMEASTTNQQEQIPDSIEDGLESNVSEKEEEAIIELLNQYHFKFRAELFVMVSLFSSFISAFVIAYGFSVNSFMLRGSAGMLELLARSMNIGGGIYLLIIFGLDPEVGQLCRRLSSKYACRNTLDTPNWFGGAFGYKASFDSASLEAEAGTPSH